MLGIKNAFAIAFIIAVLDILPVLGTGTVLIPWAVLAFASGRISTGVQNGNRGHGAVSDHHGGAQHCGAEAGGKTDGVIAGDHAAMYADRFKIFWNHRSVCSTASGFISETVE